MHVIISIPSKYELVINNNNNKKISSSLGLEFFDPCKTLLSLLLGRYESENIEV